ncbi:class I SAM-dependent methyltransferase [Alphaproteobacteria bacterium]|nr:class I SAM-dependent methyltransferase [Alphaproteobacteria bacterium]
MNQLVKIYKKYSAPEGSGDKGTAHSYIENYYHNRFDKIRLNKMNILEIGVSTGLSLEMWCEYFPNSNIIGVELDNINYKPSSQRINLIIGDGTDAKTFKNIENLDIIIDDGSHIFTDQIFTYAILFYKLKGGGIYIIEDVKDIDAVSTFFKRLNVNTKIFDFRKLKNRHDDVIIEIIKL